jgi:tripartite-type tricarboxylate transporter receptor subunit TctC
VIAKLNVALVRVLNDPDVVNRIQELGAEPMPMEPAVFAEFIKIELNKWIKVMTRVTVPPN